MDKPQQDLATPNTKLSHIAFVPFPFGSHVSTLYTLARELADVSPDSIFSLLTTPRSIAALHSPKNPKNLHLIEISDGVESEGQVSQNIVKQIELFLEAALKSVTEGLKLAEEATMAEVTCIASDAFMSMTGDIAEKMGVSWVAFWTGGSEALLAHMNTDLIRSTIKGAGEQGSISHENQTLEFTPGLSKHSVSQLPLGIITGDLNSHFAITLHQMAHCLPRATAVVATTFPGLDPNIEKIISDNFANYLPIGPLSVLFSQHNNSRDPHGCVSWLDQQDVASVVYIAFGTVATPPPAELIALAEGLEETNVHFLWSISEKGQSNLPSGFVDRMKQTGKGLFVPWAPQVEVLKHDAVGLFVSHGGWNSIQESVFTGVPMVMRPFFGDHPMNARTASRVYEIGVELEKGVFTKEEVLKLLQGILEGEEGRRIREKAGELRKIVIDSRELNGGSTKNFEKLVKDFLKC